MNLNPVMLKSQTGTYIIDTIEEFLGYTDISDVPQKTMNKLLFILQERERAKDRLVKSL